MQLFILFNLTDIAMRFSLNSRRQVQSYIFFSLFIYVVFINSLFSTMLLVMQKVETFSAYLDFFSYVSSVSCRSFCVLL